MRLPATVVVGERVLPLVVRRYRAAQGVKMRACAVSGSVRLSLPARGGEAQALALLESHAGWLAAQVARWPAAVRLVPGAWVPFEGGELLIDWEAARPVRVVRTGDRLVLGGPEVAVGDRVKRWLMPEARARLEPETVRLAAAVGRTGVAVRLGDPKGRWGSCNKASGRINYSWRLVMAPPEVLRSVVAHEVAHLVHADHGRDFWALVGRLDSHAGPSKRWLAQHGRALQLVS
ncbi:MAG: M48 family metallopeptidase [Polymorphobacter sp.]|uniref:M48 family metallopeptidase n=1 Tax=Polymorphobacter sp. TaxID=1909290 RepID=UPI003A859B45